MNYIISQDKDKTELAQYLHGCVFSPVISTFQKCIKKGNFISWPGIDNLNFKKLIKTTEPTLKGHLDQERKNVQSTKTIPPSPLNNISDETDNFPERIDNKTNMAFYIIMDIKKESTTYTDLTGRFSHQLSRGNNYIFVAYNYDANAILVEALPNRESTTIISAWKTCHDRIVNNGQAVTHYISDNECSSLFKHTLKEAEITFELVPPHQHRRNAAERAICTFKNHFLAGLASCDPEFPL